MSDSNDSRPVSFAKKASAAGSTSGGTSDKTEMARPVAAVALAAVLVLSGLASILAAVLVTGHKAYLVHSLTTNNPPVTTAQGQSAGQKVSAAVTTALAGKTASAALVTRAGDAAADAIGGKDKKDVLPSKSISDSDRSDQQDKLRSAVKSQLNGVSGTVSEAQAAGIASSLSDTTERNLANLHTKQVNDIDKTADRVPHQLLIAAIVLTAALAFVAFGAYAGRFWARWGVPVVWVLASFTSTSAGFSSLLAIKSDFWPMGYRVFAAVSAALLIIGVFMSFLRPTRAWFEAHRPALPEGMPARRGLFSPRVPPPTGGRQSGTSARQGSGASTRRPAITRTDQVHAHKAKSRGEQTEQEKAAVAAGRTRPRQASKSRRTDV